MTNKTFTQTQKMTFSAIVAAAYMTIMLITQAFAFGAYQIRIATALYALAYPFPFLVVPLALANSMSNLLMGGLGVFDIVGGFLVGLVTAGVIGALGKWKLPSLLLIFPIVAGPGFVVPLWLTHIIGVPYWALVVNISIGQTVPAVVGYILVKELKKRKGKDNA